MSEAKTVLNGILPSYKPEGLSSHDMVNEVRRITGLRRIGHTGTLDPLAEGLLVLCLGRATKVSRFVSQADKSYRAELHLGRRSPTLDREAAPPDGEDQPMPNLSRQDVDRLLDRFRGRITQTVPRYSAVRVNGRRLYELARRGIEVERPRREVVISKLTLREFAPPRLELAVTCSSGTYVRALADDLGSLLGCGAYLHRLERIAVGGLRVEDAHTLEEIERLHCDGALPNHLLDYDQVLDFAAMTVSDRFRPLVANGRELAGRDVVTCHGSFAVGDEVFLKDRSGRVLAIGTAQVAAEKLALSPNGKVFDYIRVLR